MADNTTAEQPPDLYQHPNPPNNWEAHRNDIKRLYVTEDRALPDVVKEMKRLYNFAATERMYKRRISDWDLDKNVKDDEMRAIIACQAMRLQQGKKSTFYVRGRLVERKKIDRFAQRKRVDRKALDGVHGIEHLRATSPYSASDVVSILPRGVRCITPPADGPAVIDVTPKQSGLGDSKRRLAHARTSQTKRTKRTKRIRNSEDKINAPIAPSHTRHPIGYNSADSALLQPAEKSHEALSPALSKHGVFDNHSGQPTSNDIDCSTRSTSLQFSLDQRDNTSMLSDTGKRKISQPEWNPRRIFDLWNKAFPSLEPKSLLTVSFGGANAQSDHTDLADIHRSGWQKSNDQRQAPRQQQVPRVILEHESNFRSNGQSSQSGSDLNSSMEAHSPDPASRTRSPHHESEHYLIEQGLPNSERAPSPPGLRRPSDTNSTTGSYTCTSQDCAVRFENAARSQKHRQEAHRKYYAQKAEAKHTYACRCCGLPLDSYNELEQHYREFHRDESERRSIIEAIPTSPLPDTAGLTTPVLNNKPRQIFPGSESGTPPTLERPSSPVTHRPNSRSSNTPDTILKITRQKRSQRPNDSEDTPHAPSKLAISDLLQAAHSGQPAEQQNITGLDRNMSDVYQDELYRPSMTTSALQQPVRNYTSQETILPPQNNSVFANLFQAAQSEHLRAQSASTIKSRSGERSPFVPTSPYSIPLAKRPNSATQLREQRKAETDALVFAEHQPRQSEFEIPRTISPKDVALDYNEVGEASNGIRKQFAGGS